MFEQSTDGPTRTLGADDMARVRDYLRTLLEVLDAGELDSGVIARAYLQGSLDTLSMLNAHARDDD